LLLYIAAVDLVHHAARSVDGLQNMPVVVGLPVLAGWLYLLVRLFAVPGLIVTGRAVTDAVHRSWRLTEGRGWQLLSVIVALGLGNAVFATFAVVGPALSTVFVGTIHAVYLGVFVEQSY
jgi:membrane-anchored glycerophosphoryl diester phosphodiesterase (GDPDase)